MDMDIFMDIHEKSVDIWIGYGCKIWYPRQAWLFVTKTLSLNPFIRFAVDKIKFLVTLTALIKKTSRWKLVCWKSVFDTIWLILLFFQR